jgi:hypothetical protein
MKRAIFRFEVILSILAVFIFIGCGGGSGGNGSHDLATLRVIHNSPDAPNVDVTLDDQIILPNVPYGAISGPLTFDTGERDVAVRVAGTNQSVIEATLDLEINKQYLIFASDTVSKIKPIVLVANTEKVPSGSSALRVLHGAPGAPMVDIYVTAPGQDSIDTVEPVLSGVSFAESSGYLTVPSGDYRARVTVAGTKTVAIDSGTVSLESQTSYTVFAKDNVGGGAPFGLGIVKE